MYWTSRLERFSALYGFDDFDILVVLNDRRLIQMEEVGTLRDRVAVDRADHLTAEQYPVVMTSGFQETETCMGHPGPTVKKRRRDPQFEFATFTSASVQACSAVSRTKVMTRGPKGWSLIAETASFALKAGETW